MPDIQQISNDFYYQWNTVLYDTEKRLVELLLTETQKVVEKTQTEFDDGLK